MDEKLANFSALRHNFTNLKINKELKSQVQKGLATVHVNLTNMKEVDLYSVPLRGQHL